jgi:hypothetical protein
MLRRSGQDKSSGLRKRLVAAIMVPTALVSLALMANPKIFTIFDIEVQLDTGSPASVALLFDAGQPGISIENQLGISVTRGVVEVNGQQYQTLCPGDPSITDTLPVITGTLSFCGPIVQTNGFDAELGPDLWRWNSALAPFGGGITTAVNPISITIDVRDPSLEMIQPGKVFTDPAKWFEPSVFRELVINFGDGFSATGQIVTASSMILNPDSDGDGVLDDVDACPDTVIPESVPTRRLGRNRWFLEGPAGTFTQGYPQAGRKYTVTIQDTRGCSCSQIADEMELGAGHYKFGCSTGEVLEWIDNP